MRRIVEKVFKSWWKKLYNRCEKSSGKGIIENFLEKVSGLLKEFYIKNTRRFTRVILSVKNWKFIVLHIFYNYNLINIKKG